MVDIEEIQRLEIHEGECLLIKLPRHASQEEARRVREVFSQALGQAVPLIIIGRDLEVIVVSSAEPL